MFRLGDLLDCDDIVIQCHNFPDADAISSGYAVYSFLKAHDRSARLIYSGRAEITKPNLTRMVESLSVPIKHVKEMPHIGTLVMVDCQYGESNATKLSADTVIVIDHHEDMNCGYRGIINSHLGSCSTLIWDLLNKEGFEFQKYPEVSTALYYGLYADTNGFEEIAHPLDKDMRDSLNFNRRIINMLRFNNLTITELGITGAALTRHKIVRQYSCAVFRADACDQNILGFIGDLALQVEGIDVCIVYNTLPDGYKLSIRSCTKEVMASEFAVFLAGGGGHRQKAGGFISKTKIGNLGIDDFIESRIQDYFDNCDIINADNHNLNITATDKYRKRKIPVGFVKSTDVFAAGAPMLIRTLEGDAEAEASDDVLLMVGIMGEVYPIQMDKFVKSYAMTNEPFEPDFEYSPTVKNKITGDSAELIAYIKPCIAEDETYIYAMPAAKNTKVFTAWNTEGYMYGKPGDYIAVRVDDHNDVYIIRKDIFVKSYERV